MALVIRDGVEGKVCCACDQWKPVSEYNRWWQGGKPAGDGYKARCRECANAKARADWVANSEIREKRRLYAEEHAERYTELKRQHREKYPERYKASQDTYKAKNRKLLSQKAKARRDANLELHRARGREQYAKHREKRREYSIKDIVN